MVSAKAASGKPNECSLYLAFPFFVGISAGIFLQRKLNLGPAAQLEYISFTSNSRVLSVLLSAVSVRAREGLAIKLCKYNVSSIDEASVKRLCWRQPGLCLLSGWSTADRSHFPLEACPRSQDCPILQMLFRCFWNCFKKEERSSISNTMSSLAPWTLAWIWFCWAKVPHLDVNSPFWVFLHSFCPVLSHSVSRVYHLLISKQMIKRIMGPHNQLVLTFN